nr:hypothetical protein [Tanacetum cinerariifolium]
MTQTAMDSGNVIMSFNVAFPSTSNDVCDSGNVNKDKNVESASNPNLGTPNDTSSTPAKDANLDNTNVGPVLFATLLKRDTSQKSVFSSKDRMESMLENSSWLIRNVSLILRKWTSNANIMMEEAGAMVELRADVELKDTTMVTISKFMGEGYHIKIIRVEYEWTPPGCLSCKVFGHVLDECPKQPVSDVLKKLNIPRQAVRGVQKQAQASRQEVGNSNLFDVLISVENDDDMGTNGGNSKMAEKGVNSSVVSFAYGSSPVASGPLNITPLAERINNLERKILDGKLMLVDDDGKQLNKVDYAPVNLDSDNGVEAAYDKTDQLWLVEVQMMQAYMRTKIMTYMILIILKV